MTSVNHSQRIHTIDILRGIVMVIMALDHTRDYFHDGALVYDPTDLSKSNAAVFLTRWITHFCAPAFLFLSGVSARIKGSTTTRSQLSRYLVVRGLILILLDLVVLRFAVLFNFYPGYNLLSILWLIGWCMILLAGVIHLRHWMILALSIIIIFGHNITDNVPVSPENPLYILWALFWNGGLFQLSPTIAVYSIYAIIPWLGIMMLGYFAGKWYSSPYTDKMRQRLLINMGVLSLILFFFFRYTGFYGDPRPAVEYPDALTTVLSFLNVTKYPVSLHFTLMTLGPLMIVLALLERVSRPLKVFVVFGRTAMFYFLLHFFVIHAAALVLYLIQTGKSFGDIDFHFPATFGGISSDGGVSLPWVYVAWVLIVAALYPVCVWYDRYKRVRGGWTKYL